MIEREETTKSQGASKRMIEGEEDVAREGDEERRKEREREGER